MLKTALQIICALLLCALLVYAPEIYTAVSAPYKAEQPRRVLLRVAMCPADEASEKALLDTLHLYMKEFPAVHLRIALLDEAALFSQPDPQADVFVFPAVLSPPDNRFLLLDAADGPMRCAISASTANKETAISLAGRLLSPSD